MKNKCFDIGTIQAFIDGETSGELSLSIADHAADCDYCSARIAGAEEETSYVFAALDREVNTLVPTQRLWSRINDSITEEKSRSSFGQKVSAMFSAILFQPSFGAALGVVLIFIFVAGFWTFNNETNIAGVTNTTNTTKPVSIPNEKAISRPIISNDPFVSMASTKNESPVRKDRNSYSIETAAYHPKRETRTENAPDNIKQPTAPATAYLPAEESYVKTIAGLKQNIESSDTMMPASSRVSYERDMAVVDDTISKMKKAVNKDPKNEAAKQALYASYQDKIDLLNSAAQREELMASIR